MIIHKIKNISGFTLVELLVVIAIIGILSSVAVISLSSAKDKARIARIIGEINQIRPIITLCFDNNQPLTFDFDEQDARINEQSALNQEICNNQVLWPDFLSEGWYYTVVSGDIYLNIYEVRITDGQTVVICTHNGCVAG